MDFQGSQDLYKVCNGHHCTEPKLETLRWRTWGWQSDRAPAVGPLHWQLFWVYHDQIYLAFGQTFCSFPC